MTLTTRILILIALAMTPVVAVQVFTQVELQRERAATERAEALRYERFVAGDAQRIFEGLRSNLIAISETPFVRQFDADACRTYLSRLTSHYPQIFNITLIDEIGTPVCSNTTPIAGATAIDRLYFQEAIRTGEFVIGTYIVGRTVPRPQLPVALPFRNDAGRRLVLAIGLDFTWLNSHFSDLDLPPGATVWIADRNGIVVVAPQAEAIGKPLPDRLQSARRSHEDSFPYQDADGGSHIVAFAPEASPPYGLITIVDMPRQPFSLRTRAQLRRDLAILLLSVAVAAALAAFGTRRWVSRPLRHLTAAARQWTAGTYSVRVNLSDRSSEVGQLGIAFDQMADTIETSQRELRAVNETLEARVSDRTAALTAANEQLEAEMTERQAAEASLRQSQKMEAIGQLTGGIAHDFNNLLTAIGGSIEFLHKAAPAENERAQRYYGLGREAITRAGRMTHRLLAFARQQPLEVQSVDLNRLVAGMSDLLIRTLGEDVAVETVLAGGLWPTHSDPVQLENSLLNLAINARDAMPQGGKLTIETANTFLDAAYAAAHEEVAPGQYVMLAVSDSGTGMSPDVIARAFDPFFTTKAPGKGTGLGLSMVYGFVKQSRGHVNIYSEIGRGTTVKLYLPRLRADGPTAVKEAAIRADVSAPDGQTVLVVEDDEPVRELSVAFLLDLGYAVLSACDAAGGLDLLQTHPEITVLFTDVVLTGGMSGRQLADRATREYPNLRVLFTTGYTPNAIIHGGILDPGVHLLPKPFSVDDLGAKLRAVLEQRPVSGT